MLPSADVLQLSIKCSKLVKNTVAHLQESVADTKCTYHYDSVVTDHVKIILTFARTFSKDAGLMSEKQIKNTS